MVRNNDVVFLLVVVTISSLMRIQVVTAIRDYRVSYLSPHTHRHDCVVRPSYINKCLLSIRAGDIQVVTSISQIEDIIANQASGSNQLVVLDFTANNCPPCEMIAPIYSDLSDLEEFENKVLFLKVNVNDCPDVAQRYGVDGWPTFLLFKGGKVVDSVVGGQAAKASLYSLVAKWA